MLDHVGHGEGLAIRSLNDTKTASQSFASLGTYCSWLNCQMKADACFPADKSNYNMDSSKSIAIRRNICSFSCGYIFHFLFTLYKVIFHRNHHINILSGKFHLLKKSKIYESIKQKHEGVLHSRASIFCIFLTHKSHPVSNTANPSRAIMVLIIPKMKANHPFFPA